VEFDVAHGIGDTALIHFKISMRFLIFIEVRPIIYQKLQNFANLNNVMLKGALATILTKKIICFGNW
jgi:hypothetical protein